MKKLSLWIFMVLVLVSCSEKPTKTTQVEGIDGNIYETIAPWSENSEKIKDYGNGVYYFKYLNESFAQQLSAFILAHPELEFVSIAGNGSNVHRSDKGYYVIFRKD